MSKHEAGQPNISYECIQVGERQQAHAQQAQGNLITHINCEIGFFFRKSSSHLYMLKILSSLFSAISKSFLIFIFLNAMFLLLRDQLTTYVIKEVLMSISKPPFIDLA